MNRLRRIAATPARTAAAILFLTLGLAACLGLLLDRLFPFPVERLDPPAATRVLDRDGKPLRFFLAADGMWRFPLTLEEISPDLTAALIDSEDRHFLLHPGINPLSVLRALWVNVRHGRVISGASTIPMQVARLADPRPRTLGAKAVEALRALQLCWHYPKEKILLWYVNLAPFGSNMVGVGAAAWYYFGKAPDTLSLGEIALLSVLPRSPTRYNPLSNPERARKVRDRVLDRFAAHGVFDPARIAESTTRPLLARRASVPQGAPHFSRWMRSRLPERAVIRSSLDRRAQDIVEKLLCGRMEGLRRQAIDNAAAVVLDIKSREILAYAGSADFWDDSRPGQVDNALSRRSPGSTLKPFLYALAFDQGHLVPGSMLLDVPTDFAGYVPENYGQNFQGLVSARTALATSLNVPAARLLTRCGLIPFHELLRRGGLSTLDRPASHYGLSMALGGCEVRLLELTNLYATLADAGMHRAVRPLAGGQDEYSKGVQLFSPEASAMTLGILSTTRRPDLPDAWEFTLSAPKVAWKTGTSFGHRDAWAVGVSRDLAIGVWVGNPDGSQCTNISGARHAGPLLFDLFRALSPRTTQLPSFPTPALQRIKICAVSGERPGPGCPVTTSMAIAGVTSLPVCGMHRQIFVNPGTGLRLHGDCLLAKESTEEAALVWPAELVAFRRAQGSNLPGLPGIDPECLDVPEEGGPVIQSPSAGTPYHVRTDAPPKFQRLALSAAGAAGASIHYWYVDGRHVGRTAPETPCFIPLERGMHEVIVTDDQGRSARTTFTVHARTDDALGSRGQP
ncbi:penicillin-binding protein 1C [Desulfomicrobium sp. ZS1]|uniref:penicillin-binding protein 1C n=1 Tax=Desulfomicrobium sp. ZS1 TaxID=2952228 RepID=UPI0020B24E77|nr:penicillin-binding protein 1C [Desulfomicrobium sp. ZS1]UTF49498.1 penicillin-binding protein 1C [Desulfomicrobium sp. ZS1]